jgi:hypothetical protein
MECGFMLEPLSQFLQGADKRFAICHSLRCIIKLLPYSSSQWTGSGVMGAVTKRDECLAAGCGLLLAATYHALMNQSVAFPAGHDVFVLQNMVVILNPCQVGGRKGLIWSGPSCALNLNAAPLPVQFRL